MMVEKEFTMIVESSESEDEDEGTHFGKVEQKAEIRVGLEYQARNPPPSACTQFALR